MALWSPEVARQMSVKAIAARQSARLSRQNRLDLVDKLLLQAANPTDKPQVASDALSNEFTQRRLMRVREQLDRLDDMLAKATDSKVIKELADATTRLQTQEQQLSGRPLVASVKPTQPSKAQRTTQGPSLPPATS